MAATAARDLAVPAPRSTRPRIGDDVYDRDDSLKESTNPKSLPGKNHNHNGASQRFSGNLKPTAAPIIGVSGNLGQGQLSARRHHRPPAMFPKKANTGGGGREPKTAVPEPGSPKVSCIGKVLSGRERARPRHRSPTGGCCLGLGFSIRRSRSRKSAVESGVRYTTVSDSARLRAGDTADDGETGSKASEAQAIRDRPKRTVKPNIRVYGPEWSK
jgi:hypothetical protein